MLPHMRSYLTLVASWLPSACPVLYIDQPKFNNNSNIFILRDTDQEVIYGTRETVFHWDIQTPRRELKIIRGVWIADETLSLVFDISSQSEQKLRSKRRSKIVKICLFRPGIQTFHRYDYLCFNLMNY